MFQGLTQGAVVPVLYKNIPRVAEGKVLSVNTHIPQFNPAQPAAMFNGPVTDITLQIDNDTLPLTGLPANGVVANFPDRGIFVSTDRGAILREVASLQAASRQVLDSVPAHQKMVADCDALMDELNPDRKREAQKEEEMNSLRNDVSELKQLVLAALGAKNNKEK